MTTQDKRTSQQRLHDRIVCRCNDAIALLQRAQEQILRGPSDTEDENELVADIQTFLEGSE